SRLSPLQNAESPRTIRLPRRVTTIAPQLHPLSPTISRQPPKQHHRIPLAPIWTKSSSKSRSNCAHSRNKSASDCSSSKNKRAPRLRHDRQIRRKNSGWSNNINSRHSNSSSNMRKSKSSWNENSSRNARTKRNPKNRSILQRNNLEVHGHFGCFR